MQRYDGAAQHKGHFKGGAYRLSWRVGGFSPGDSEQTVPWRPERFYRLFTRVPDTRSTSATYGPSRRLRRVRSACRQNIPLPDRDRCELGMFKRHQRQALDKRVRDALPDDVLDLLEPWFLSLCARR